MISKQVFNILTDTGGDFVDTGPAFDGAVVQVRYVADGSTPLDSGADILLDLIPSGVRIADYDNIGAGSFTKIPKLPVADTGGANVSALREFAHSAGESLRLTVNQSDGATGTRTGKVHVWTRA